MIMPNIGNLKRKARRIELQAGRSAPVLAAQLRLLAAQYYAEVEALTGARKGVASAAKRHDRPAIMHSL